MDEAEWLVCTEPQKLLEFLRDNGRVSERKGRLFATACCRRFLDLLPDEGRKVLDVAERHADGLAGREEWATARDAFLAVLHRTTSAGRPFFANAAVSYLLADYRNDPAGYEIALSPWAAGAGRTYAEEHAAQNGLLRCIFSNPIRPVSLDPTWRTPTVLALAQAAYEERILPAIHLERDRLAILADALEDAGCDNADIVSHLRGPGPHVRGCWPLDLLLGQE